MQTAIARERVARTSEQGRTDGLRSRLNDLDARARRGRRWPRTAPLGAGAVHRALDVAARGASSRRRRCLARVARSGRLGTRGSDFVQDRAAAQLGTWLRRSRLASIGELILGWTTAPSGWFGLHRWLVARRPIGDVAPGAARKFRSLTNATARVQSLNQIPGRASVAASHAGAWPESSLRLLGSTGPSRATWSGTLSAPRRLRGAQGRNFV